MAELLAPAGNTAKLLTALHFGADAVYVGGMRYGLRANAGNFNENELVEAIAYAHARGKKLYVTCNIVAHNEDFEGLAEYLTFLETAKADAVIVSDPGVLSVAIKTLNHTQIHLSTQANVCNGYAAAFWADQGVKRIVLARELNLSEILQIRRMLPDEVELEAFVHGAMCIAHSGRCLLSNFLSGRDGNRGDCVQACRWRYEIHEVSRGDHPLIAEEDGRGTYLLNSKDLNLLPHLKELSDAGVSSFKIEGRMKSEYYVAATVNAYRRAVDELIDYGEVRSTDILLAELDKTAHRDYTTGFLLNDERHSVNNETSQAKSEYAFTARVMGYDEADKAVVIEQRNRFKEGDILEILSADAYCNGKQFKICGMRDAQGNRVFDAKAVQQVLRVDCPFQLSEGDILRKRENVC